MLSRNAAPIPIQPDSEKYHVSVNLKTFGLPSSTQHVSVSVHVTSFMQRAAEGRSGGAGRRQLRLQGFGVFGGSSAPHEGLQPRAAPNDGG